MSALPSPPPASASQPGLLTRIYLHFRDDIAKWCGEDRSVALRVPLLLLMGYIAVNQWLDPAYWSIFGHLNLPIHEGGHLIFRFAGEFICVAGGTFLQCFVPVASMFMFLKQRDYFAIALCFGWLSTNLYGVALYMADAQKQILQLVTVGDTGGRQITHDFHYLFSKLGVLRQCETIGFLTRQLGSLCMLLCLGGMIWLLWKIAKSPVKRGPAVRID